MRAEIALIAVLLSGCSMVSMERLGAYRRDATPQCTSNPVPMVIDGIVATAYGGVGVGMAALGDQQEIAAGAGALAVFAAASAVYGWREHKRCRRAFEAHDQFLEFETLMRQPLGAPGSE